MPLTPWLKQQQPKGIIMYEEKWLHPSEALAAGSKSLFQREAYLYLLLLFTLFKGELQCSAVPSFL